MQNNTIIMQHQQLPHGLVYQRKHEAVTTNKMPTLCQKSEQSELHQYTNILSNQQPNTNQKCSSFLHIIHIFILVQCCNIKIFSNSIKIMH